MKSKLLSSFLVVLMMSTFCIDKVNASCGAPTGITLVDLGTTTARFEWTPVPGASYYKVQYRKAGVGVWQTRITGTSSCDLTGLSSGVSYELHMQTNCQYGLSAVANYDKFTMLSHPINTPGGFSAHSLSPNSAMLSWAVVPGGCNYTVQWKISTSSNWTTVTGIASTSFNLGALAPCTEYQVRVRTTCFNSGSTYSTPTTFMTPGCLIDNNNNNQTAGAKLAHKDIENPVQFELYPNPVRDNLKVEYNSPANGEVTVTIYNILGKNMMSSKNTVDEGKNSINLNTTELADGLYLFELEHNGELIRSKFMIRK